eukprot:7893965-Pyramimonas_sp.AAC.1
MSQDTKGIGFSINEETLAFAIQSLVNNTLRTWRRRNKSFGTTPACRQGLRPRQPAGEDISGHPRGGNEGGSS